MSPDDRPEPREAPSFLVPEGLTLSLRRLDESRTELLLESDRGGSTEGILDIGRPAALDGPKSGEITLGALADAAAAAGTPILGVVGQPDCELDVRTALRQALAEQASAIHDQLVGALTAEPRRDVRLTIRYEVDAPAADLPWEGLGMIGWHREVDTPIADRKLEVVRVPEGAHDSRLATFVEAGGRLRVLLLVGHLEQTWKGGPAELSTTATRDEVIEGLHETIALLKGIEGITIDIVATEPIAIEGVRLVRRMKEVRVLLRDEARGGYHIVSTIGHSDAKLGPGSVEPGTSADPIRPARGLSFRFVHPVSGDRLRTRTLGFKNLARDLQHTRTRLLVLQACRLPSTAAAGLLQAVEHVVGFCSVVSPSTARDFAQPFFAAVAAPTDIAEAVGIGRFALARRDELLEQADSAASPSAWMPVHHARDPGSSAFVDIEAQHRQRYAQRVRAECNTLPTALDDLFDGNSGDLLQEVYVELDARPGRNAHDHGHFEGELLIRQRQTRELLDPAPLTGWLERRELHSKVGGLRLLLFGDPGTGKTTVLKQLAVQLLATSWLPIRVRLEDLLDAEVSSLADLASGPGVLRDTAAAELTESRLRQAAATGRIVLLLDGFDEVSDPERARTRIDKLASDVGDGVTIVASRKIVSGLPQSGQDHVWWKLRVGDLGVDQQEKLIRNWLTALRRHADPRAFRWLASVELEDAVAKLSEIVQQRAFARVCNNPLWLTLTVVHCAETGPDDPDRPLPADARGLLDWMIAFVLASEHRASCGFDDVELPRRLLSRLALRLLVTGDDRLAIRDKGKRPTPELREWLRSWSDAGSDAPSVVRGLACAEFEGRPVGNPEHWRWSDRSKPSREPTLLDRFGEVGLFVPASSRLCEGRFVIQPFADLLAAEALVEEFVQFEHETVHETELAGVKALLAWVGAHGPKRDTASESSDDSNGENEVASEDPRLGRWAETMALVTSWLQTEEAKLAWLVGLVEVDQRLGLRALGLTLDPPVEAVVQVLGKGDAEDKQRFWDGFAAAFGTQDHEGAKNAVALLDKAARSLHGGTDRFFIEEEAIAIAESHESLLKSADEVVGRVRSHRSDRDGLQRLQTEPGSQRALWRRIHKLGQEEFGYGEERKSTPIPEPFWMMSVPVTVGMYGLFDPEHRQRWRGKWYRGAERTDENDTIHHLREDLPVTNVTWFAAIAYTRWLNAVLLPEIRAGKLLPELHSKANQDDYRFRLPTEREWEWACRAGTTTKYWCGDKLTKSVAWFDKDWHEDGVRPVGEGDPNPHFDLREMHGNAWEWCADAFGDQHEMAVRLSGRGSDRVLRGGAFGFTAEHCRSAARSGSDPAWDVIVGVDGFRPVFAAPLPSSDRPIEDRS